MHIKIYQLQKLHNYIELVVRAVSFQSKTRFDTRQPVLTSVLTRVYKLYIVFSFQVKIAFQGVAVTSQLEKRLWGLICCAHIL